MTDGELHCAEESHHRWENTITPVSKNPAGFGGDSTANNYTLNSTQAMSPAK
jgi:hypothetical protein